jgi:hypothetical protein
MSCDAARMCMWAGAVLCCADADADAYAEDDNSMGLRCGVASGPECCSNRLNAELWVKSCRGRLSTYRVHTNFQLFHMHMAVVSNMSNLFQPRL